MTDQPQGPTEPREEPSAAPADQDQPAPPPPTEHPPPPAAAVPPPGQAAPEQQRQPDYYGAPQQQPVYGAAAPPAYGAPQQQYGAPQQPAYPPPAANPYGGYTQAPAYAGGRPMHPGSVGYVEQYFGPVAAFGQRALALIIDTLITFIGLVPMVIGFIVLIASAPSGTGMYDDNGYPMMSDGDGGMAAVGGILIAIGGILMIAIFLWNRVFRMGRTGQSVGKSAMGLKLVDDKSGQPIGAGMAFLREIVHAIANQIFYLSYLWMLWDTDKQTLGDKAVHSTVIVVPKQG